MVPRESSDHPAVVFAYGEYDENEDGTATPILQGNRTDPAHASFPPKPRRSLSEVIFPRALSTPPADPLAPQIRRQEKAHGDDGDADTNSSEEDSSSTDDTEERAYRDDLEDDSIVDEKDLFLGMVEDGFGGLGDNKNARRSSIEIGSRAIAVQKRRKMMCTGATVIVVFLLLSTFFASHLISGRHSFHGRSLKPISMEHVANGTFDLERVSLDWLAEAGDGVYSYRSGDGSIILEDVKENTTKILVRGENVKDENGQQLLWQTFQVSADLKYVLFGADRIKLWRHSTHSNFYIHDMVEKTTAALRQPYSFPPHTAIAKFSPMNHHIAYVHANDLYVYENPPMNGDRKDVIRLTTDGSPTTFNGVPDWVYEEEIFSGDSATWWSPDGNKIAFLSFDEQDVPEYEFPIYNPSSWDPVAPAYPEHVIMRYPKPGYPNPKVQMRVFDLHAYTSQAMRPSSVVSSDATKNPEVDPRVAALTYTLVFSKPFDEHEVVISEVTWVGPEDLMIKATDRTAQIQRVAHFKLGEAGSLVQGGKLVGEVVREDDFVAIDGGWAEAAQTMVGIDTSLLQQFVDIPVDPTLRTYPAGYLDVVPNKDGFNHLAYFSPPDAKEPVFLTSGYWEVEGKIEAVDVIRGLVYFIGSNPSIERHLYSVPLPKSEELQKLQLANTEVGLPRQLTSTDVPGYHSTSFSPFGGFYVLDYEGPEVPWQYLVKVDDTSFHHVLSNNTDVERVLTDFKTIEIKYSTMSSEGHDLNVMELRPSLMDKSGRTKHPVLFQVYGGPASQMVSRRWQRDWHSYLVTSLGYVVVRVDPRGTGSRGRSFRMPVRGRLGSLEVTDVVNVAREYSQLNYIDEKRLGIWGWSYGGFLTSKVIESNSSVFTLGMAVAPVTDWRYYDSIYTERYMSTPELNRAGYDNSSVHDMDGFKHVDFALAHGSGDDNVHFLNTAVFLDRLTTASVQKFRFRMFTDSDHGINRRGAYWELMTWLSDFLVEKWGEGGVTKHRWKLDKVNEQKRR